MRKICPRCGSEFECCADGEVPQSPQLAVRNNTQEVTIGENAAKNLPYRKKNATISGSSEV